MNRIQGFERVIGVVLRGGSYFPSNHKSEEKWNEVFLHGKMIPKAILHQEGFRWFRDHAREMGYKVLVCQRGLNR